MQSREGATQKQVRDLISPLVEGNRALSEKKYTTAIPLYLKALLATPSIGRSIAFNIRQAKQKYRVTRKTADRQCVGVCGWELAYKSANRVCTLAKLYETFSEVEIIGTFFPKFGTEIWEPILKIKIPVHSFVVEDETRFFDHAVQLIAAHPYDIVHLSNPRITNIFFGMLYKLIWDAKVFVDIDDEELVFVDTESSINIDDYIKMHGNLPILNDLVGKEWTCLAAGLAKGFDSITVSSPALQKRYGGKVIPQVWDERRFQPSSEFEGKSSKKFGIRSDKKVILGTSCHQQGFFNENLSCTSNSIQLKTLINTHMARSGSAKMASNWCSVLLAGTSLSHLALDDKGGSKKIAHVVVPQENGPQLTDTLKSIIKNKITPEDIKKTELHKCVDLIASSSIFDRAWYLCKYKDVANKGIDPISHYLRDGAREGRDPGPWFSSIWYLDEYIDVRASGANPLVHYLRYGQQEGRLPMPPMESVRPPWWSQLTPDLQTRSLEKRQDARNSIDVSGALARMSINLSPPAIIIPVYNAPSEVDDCLRCLLLYTSENCRIIVIDDASSDTEVRKVLDRYQEISSIEVYHNEENLGHTRTINLGIGLAGEADVVFLNSDTKVTIGWLRNLRLAVYSEDRIGTATPFSNNAGTFSAPVVGKLNSLPASVIHDEYARAITQSAQRTYPKVPTGNGFCLYVRRDCLRETGLLDEEAFPSGYGEELDFCMRSGQLGWMHIIDDATLIYHVRSASFGDAKTELMVKGQAVIDARYPEYAKAIRTFTSCERLKGARERLGSVASILSSENEKVKPRILYVLSTRTGGTPQTNQDLMIALDDRIEAFVLVCHDSIVTLMYFQDGNYIEMEMHVLNKLVKAFPHRSDEYDAVVANWIVKYAIELIHIRHIAWHSLGLVDVIKALELPVVFSFHDFYTVCPTVKLLSDTGHYCGGKCTTSEGQCRHELWHDPDLPSLNSTSIQDWRKKFAAMLEKCDLFVTTSESAKDVIAATYQFIDEFRFIVIPHGRNFAHFEQLALPIVKGESIRILVPGSISKAKGAKIISELGRHAREANIEVHILGDVSKDVDVTAGIICHGRYKREQFAEKVREIKPHIGGVFSIWPETYCHTLTELWACGVPPIGFDFGAVGDRIRESTAGWLTLVPTVKEILQIIERLRTNVEEHREKLEAVKKWQVCSTTNYDCQHMGQSYYDIYRSIMIGTTVRING